MKMHYCTCQINLSGQGIHIINILATEPMSWPELQLMQAEHHDENVFDIKPVAVIETDQISEKRRLLGKYTSKHGLIEQLFPGRNPTSMELLMPGETTDQPPADEFGVPQPAIVNEDEDEALGREPPTGPAVFKPRQFPQPPRVDT